MRAWMLRWIGIDIAWLYPPVEPLDALHLRPSISPSSSVVVGVGARITLPGCGTNRKYARFKEAGSSKGKHGGGFERGRNFSNLSFFPRSYMSWSDSLFVEQTGRAYFSTRKANFPEDGDISSVHRWSKIKTKWTLTAINGVASRWSDGFRVCGHRTHALETGPEDRNRSVALETRPREKSVALWFPLSIYIYWIILAFRSPFLVLN